MRLLRQNEAAPFKGPDTPVEAGLAFRKESKGRSCPKRPARSTKGFDGGVRIMSIHGHVPGTAEMPSQERDPEQLLLGREPERNWKSDEDNRNIDVTLVIDEEDIG